MDRRKLALVGLASVALALVIGGAVFIARTDVGASALIAEPAFESEARAPDRDVAELTRPIEPVRRVEPAQAVDELEDSDRTTAVAASESEPEPALEPLAALHVVDALDGRELTNVLVAPCKAAGFGRSPLHPGFLREPEGTVHASPIPRAELENGQHWITAPGHEWRLAVLSDAPPPLVALAPAADLAVEIRGRNFCGHDFLRVRASDGREVDFAETAGGDCELEKLAPGWTEVALVRDRGMQGEQVLAASSVLLVAGERARLVLDVQEPEFAPLVQVSGRIVAAPSVGGLRKLRYIEIRPLDVVSRNEVDRVHLSEERGDVAVLPDGSEARWNAVEIPAGTYYVEIAAWGIRFEMVVPPVESYEAVFEVPFVREVRLDFVDAVTREPVAPRWAFASSGTLVSSSPLAKLPGAGVRLEGTSGTATVAGPTLNLVVGRSEMHQRVTLDVSASEEVFLVPLSGSHVVDLVLQRDGVECMAPLSWWESLDLRPVDGSGARLLGWTYAGPVSAGGGTTDDVLVARLRAEVSHLGRYELRLRGLLPRVIEFAEEGALVAIEL